MIVSFLINRETELLDSCYVAFISNASQTVPLWRQRAGDQANDGHIIWDYHVIMVSIDLA